jgi:hypothetical protein
VQEYVLFYVTAGNDGGPDLRGSISVYQRGDGLSAIVDMFHRGQPDTTPMPDELFQPFYASFRAAPALGAYAALASPAAVRVTTAHPSIRVRGLAGFTAATGFTSMGTRDGYGGVSNGTEDWEVDAITGQADINAALASAEAILATKYSAVTLAAPIPVADPQPGIHRLNLTWNGTYTANGKATQGTITVMFDAANKNAFALLDSWYTTADNQRPYAAQALFMWESFNASYTSIP